MSEEVHQYLVLGGRLMLGAEELLSGPVPEVQHMAHVLNAANPADDRIALTVRALIHGTRDCSFACGSRLMSDGTPVVRLTKALAR